MCVSHVLMTLPVPVFGQHLSIAYLLPHVLLTLHHVQYISHTCNCTPLPSLPLSVPVSLFIFSVDRSENPPRYVLEAIYPIKEHFSARTQGQKSLYLGHVSLM